MAVIRDLRRLEKRLGSKKKLADELGISLRLLYYLLQGKQPAKPLEKLIKIYASTK